MREREICWKFGTLRKDIAETQEKIITGMSKRIRYVNGHKWLYTRIILMKRIK